MKINKDIKFTELTAQIDFAMYKRGLTYRMMSQLFGVTEKYFEEVINGVHSDNGARKILKEIIMYF